MKTSHRPRIGIAFPGINYVPDTPTVLNTLPFARYLQEDFEVTLIFRSMLLTDGLKFNYQTILDPAHAVQAGEGAYFSPAGLAGTVKYMGQLNRFAQAHAQDFDLVLERQWSLVGSFSSAFSRYGVPTISTNEAEYYTPRLSQQQWQKNPIGGLSTLAFKYALPWLRKRWIQQAKGLVVETDQMTQFLLARHYAPSDKPIYPIPNGINSTHFFPGDRLQARAKLGLSPDAMILVYVGSLNRFIQEPVPLIEALARTSVPGLELHMVGDGKKRKELEHIAKTLNAPVVFHGKRPQQDIGDYIAAANLCVAPYNKSLFQDGEFTSASLKVCEYLACGRPVLTVPCDRMEHVLQHGRYGFLVENEVEHYSQFFRALPSAADLAAVEEQLIADLNASVLRANRVVLTWDDVGEMYREAIQKTLALA